ncbi:cation:proton antiporter [Dissulfurirhabdus thermomarina]|uniref:Cation:proton antiporter n=1 Tax=Dissulfurirhabdus thermomarina TaxID=1765737 RepID=A0A6N9TQD6_DISTH|nr:cation:proton antiporter [Dissulfurirhabdus thermomarina]NDY43475.1 cation:proton antiporter [Dissulfurirhabdus thermomarina]NMX23238.1 cation:proton antiporter [Dissulfurirhabdus thermomarina]
MENGEGLALLIIAVAGATLPLLARPLRVPPMVAEMLFGILLAQAGFNRAFSGAWLPFLAQFGFLMLMFHAGLEIDFAALRREPAGRLAVYALAFGLTLGLAYGAARLLGHGLFLALVLSTTSLGLMLPALRELGISKTPLGQSVLISATLADFCTLLGLTGMVLYGAHGFGWRLVGPIPVFVLFGVVLWGVRLAAWWHPHRAVRFLEGSDPQELGVRAAFALLFVFVGISELVGLEPILGAFLGGCVLSVVFEDRGLLEEKLAGFAYGFLIPIFFIHVGLEFPLSAFAETGFLVFTGKLLVAALLVKLIPALLLRLRGLGWRHCLLAGLLLSARLSLIVAAAAIGVEKGLLSPRMEPAILTLALVTASLVPVAFRRLALRWGAAGGGAG